MMCTEDQKIVNDGGMRSYFPFSCGYKSSAKFSVRRHYDICLMMWAGWEHIPHTLISIQPIHIYSILAPLSPQPPPRIYKYNNITKCLQITYIIEIIFDSEGCFMCLLKFNSLKMLFQARIYYYIFYCVRICNSFFFLFFFFHLSSFFLHVLYM